MGELTECDREELAALAIANDAVGGPSFIARHHWHESGYRRLARAGLVTWGEPPEAFDRRRFAGIQITAAGRAALAARALVKEGETR